MKLNIQLTNIQYFRRNLLRWNREVNSREMPWKGEKDPYKIWLSEIILQQTRVEQGLKYYEKFVLKYPTIQHLARAKDDAVFKMWEGLGYYNRCRNMLFTARYITSELGGVFPTEYEEILSLKGVGVYTASAIASFAFNKPYAVVDGNVVRVLSRFLAINRQLVTAEDKKVYQEVADAFLAKRSAGEYNQAIMDFGATVCTPQSPSCTSCPLRNQCAAYQQNAVEQFPPKKKKLILKKRYFHYVLWIQGKNTYLRQRIQKGIWQSLYEPILVEQKTKPTWLKGHKVVYKTQQKLSHQHLYLSFYILNKEAVIPINIESYKKMSLQSLPKKAFPKSVYEFLKEFEYI